MRRSPLLALGLALSLGAGLAPLATAAPAAPAASDGAGGLVAKLGSVQRETGATRSSAPVAKSSGVAAALPPAGAYFRLAGANRYATAVAVSQDLVCGPTETAQDCEGLGGVDSPVDTVFVASGTDFPDALGAGPLASGLGPLLLVPPTGTLPSVVTTELKRIKPEFIVIFGGTGAVSSGVETQLKAYASNNTVDEVSRIAGTNRYDTAAQTALQNDEILRAQDTDNDGTADDLGTQLIVLASGEGFADALSGGGAAANSWGSLMLTAKGSLPGATKNALQTIKPPKVIILGGTGAVSTAVENAVKAAVPATVVERAAGSDRFGTAIALSKKVFTVSSPANELFLVNGYNFPDALASAPSAGFWGASTLLTKATCVTSGTRTEAIRLDPQRVTAFGGTAVVNNNAWHLGTSC